MSASEIAFHWRAKFTMAGFMPGVVVDSFENGRGRLDAWIFWFLRVAHADGPKVDRSEIQRYLAELVWCPMALVQNPMLRFEELSSDSIRVSAYDDETYVDLDFDDLGDIVGVRSLTRFRESETQPWEGRFEDYQESEGIRYPAFGEVAWDAPDGKFVYWRANVTKLEVVASDASR